MDETQREVDEIRKERSEVENHIIDEYAAGRLSRRDFVRRGTVIGMSIPMVAFLAAACGGGGDGDGGGETTAPADTGGPDTGAPAETAPPVAGGTFRLGVDDAGRDAEPGHGSRSGRPRHERVDGRVPDAVARRSRGAASARRKLVSERGR